MRAGGGRCSQNSTAGVATRATHGASLWACLLMLFAALSLALVLGLRPALADENAAPASEESGVEAAAEVNAEAEGDATTDATSTDEGMADPNADISPLVAGEQETVVDAASIGNWEGYLSDGTENVGRIWTDKSVFAGDTTLPGGSISVDMSDDANFLVALSALSSASSAKSTVTITQPLDIVLVLDRSGSMDESLGGQQAYYPVYDNEVIEAGWFEWGSETYYGLTENGQYVRIQEETTWSGRHESWQFQGRTVEPKANSADNASNHIQFYVHRSPTKMDALRIAVSNFIDETVAQNQSIADQANQHRIAIVSYASGSTTDIGLTYATQTNAGAIHSAVDELVPTGATEADSGMNRTQGILNNNGRPGAKKIVVFFTDGEPGQNGFAAGTANSTINYARQMKQGENGATIYTIGMFNGANPSGTDRVNAYMNAVSSNYPNAQSYTSLGQRDPDGDFYKAATNADDLNAIFQEISDEISSTTTSGAPTQVDEGADPNQSGYITFTDTLGDYMEVKDFNAIVFAGNKVTQHDEPAGGTSYTFRGQFEASPVYPAADLSNIKISVTKGTGSAGDTVTVQLPASMIPLRYFDVNSEDGEATMSITDALPVRIFYSVGLRDSDGDGTADVLEELNDPDGSLQSYIDANSDAGTGDVYFYSNAFTKGATNGSTTAVFEPSLGNTFYYFTANTPLYDGDGSTTPAGRGDVEAGNAYYQRVYWVPEDNGGARQVTGWVRYNGPGIIYAGGNAYIQAGTAKSYRMGEVVESKQPNATGTASGIIQPSFDGRVVTVALGNNGRLSVEMPGTLSVTKNVTIPEGFDEQAEAYYDGQSFEFTITAPGAANKSLPAVVRNAQGDIEGTAFELSFNASGVATHSLKNGETLFVYGLSDGDSYTVSETQANTGGYTTTITGDDASADDDVATGTIEANAVKAVTFANAYDVKPVTASGADHFKGAKLLEGDRGWLDSDSFTFSISSEGAAPLPAEKTKTISGADVLDPDSEVNPDEEGWVPFAFGDVEYTKPGVYTYLITEESPAAALPGMSYSNAGYQVVVTVTDNHDGTMSVTSEMSQLGDDEGQEGSGPVADKTARFTNSFSLSTATLSLAAMKDYTDTTGGKPLTAGMFSTELKPVGDNAADAPMPEAGVTGDGANRVATADNRSSGRFVFVDIAFANTIADGTVFTYELSEVNGGVPGMEYSTTVYTIKVTVNVSASNEVTLDTVYTIKGGDGTELTGPDGAAYMPEFSNTYDPEDATLTSDAGNAIHGAKTLSGRDMIVSEDPSTTETYGFTLTPANNAARTGLADGTITFTSTDVTDEARVSGGKNGQPSRSCSAT